MLDVINKDLTELEEELQRTKSHDIVETMAQLIEYEKNNNVDIQTSARIKTILEMMARTCRKRAKINEDDTKGMILNPIDGKHRWL